ncbi:MAG TPA: dTMP kinase [bacterium]
MFLTFEGIDGSGKSTQIARTENYLKARGFDVLVAREPGGTRLGEAIRAILLDPRWSEMTARAEFFLYSASRAQLVEQTVRPHLAKERAVMILDRYDDSSSAYQGGGRELGLDAIEAINRFATGGLAPDMTFVLDLDWPTSCARRAKAGMENDRLEQNAHDFFERTRAAYHDLAARHPGRMVLIDATQSEDAVFAEIKQALEEKLPLS